jgi:coenzyme F420-0:L-glutamate ligase/coenzyme F420-1:gamma-L-glutamate ligase
MSPALDISPIAGLPEVVEGANLGEMFTSNAGEMHDGDVLVVSQKVVSKAEGRIRDLGVVEPGERALDLARALDKDPRLVELILAEASAIVRAERGVLIVRTRSGLVCANAGIDESNVPGDGRVALLPEDPDGSARRIRAELRAAAGASPAVVIADSFGRPWRLGQVDVAIGCAGLTPLDDRRGGADREGRELIATEIAIADQAAAAADLVRDKAGGVPAVLIRGLERFVTAQDGPGAAALRRAEAEDLFR